MGSVMMVRRHACSAGYKIKHFRRVFSRLDKTAQSCMGFLNVVATRMWLR
jgi:hypothetical protein